MRFNKEKSIVAYIRRFEQNFLFSSVNLQLGLFLYCSKLPYWNFIWHIVFYEFYLVRCVPLVGAFSSESLKYTFFIHIDAEICKHITQVWFVYSYVVFLVFALCNTHYLSLSRVGGMIFSMKIIIKRLITVAKWFCCLIS